MLQLVCVTQRRRQRLEQLHGARCTFHEPNETRKRGGLLVVVCRSAVSLGPTVFVLFLFFFPASAWFCLQVGQARFCALLCFFCGCCLFGGETRCKGLAPLSNRITPWLAATSPAGFIAFRVELSFPLRWQA